MLGTLVAGPGYPQEGASGTHVFDSNGDVAGSGYEICTFWVMDDETVDFDCHSSWGLLDGLEDNGIPQNEDECPFSDEQFCADMEATCDGETAADGTACGEAVAQYCEDSDDEACAAQDSLFAEMEEWCGDAEFEGEDEWETAFCAAINAEPEPEPEPPVAVIGCMDDTANNYNADATEDDPSNPCTFDAVEPEPEPEEEADEVPGFGLLSAVAAIGVVLLLRRRL